VAAIFVTLLHNNKQQTTTTKNALERRHKKLMLKEKSFKPNDGSEVGWSKEGDVIQTCDAEVRRERKKNLE